MLTIGQLASYAGVTVRTIRHYHAIGLLPEPERDHSGYRRYDAAAVVELVRVRTLADAGVPLSRVHELLEADQAEFVAAVAQIDRRLRAEIRERQRHRQRIAQLAAGDALALPSEAVAYLDQLRAVGVPEQWVAAERDGWILVAAQLPEQIPVYMRLKQQQIADPGIRGLYRDMAQAISWSPEDPRVVDMVDRLVAQFETVPDSAWKDDPLMTDDLVALLDSVFLDSVPCAARMMQLLEARGWVGWTKIRRIGRRPGPGAGQRRRGSESSPAAGD